MRIVLLSGGSGKRLWPLSNDSRSKQFLKVMVNSQGIKESMIQRIWSQLQALGLDTSSVISTSKSQVDIIQSQLGEDIRLIIEPERRDTFPAIGLAAAYLYSIEGVGLGETVIVMPVDSHVELDFFEHLFDLDRAIQASQADLALIGAKPTYPSTKYGYVIPEKEGETDFYLPVEQFKEKPDEALAKEFIEHGALWNCGVFGFKLDTVIRLLIDKGHPIQFEELIRQYSHLPKISFDYEVAEKAKHRVVIPYDGAWMDLGTWNTLTEEMPAPISGKAVLSEDSKNTHVINELDIPIMVLGLSDIVVASSPDGILVSHKRESPRVKELVQDVEQRPMYEERRWGWYRVLDYIKLKEGYEVLTKRLGVSAGKNLSYQKHFKRSEVWTIISGEGEFVLDGHLFHVSPGSVLQIPVGAKHAIKALTDLELIEVQYGSDLVEEDIIRICMTWEEVERELDIVNL